MGISYKDSGVDIEKGDLFVERISKMVKSTYNPNVISGVGGFCALYQMSEDRFLATSTDGVGTKIKLAIELGIHHTIGIDLVAMCVNDLICSGARPLFFLDYFASSKLDLLVSEKVIEGIVDGCHQSQMALIGGETAEMPGMYQPGDYDLAGFSVGEVFKDKLIDGKNIKAGDTLIALKSSGFHSNGYSLVRKILDTFNAHDDLKKACLTPTKIYVRTIMELISREPNLIKGMANITGSGFLNIPRMNENFDYVITKEPELPWFMQEICTLSGLSKKELFHTFNMGAGMVLATSEPERLLSFLKEFGESAIILGLIENGTGEVRLDFLE